MPSLKSLKNRINSVKSTRKITKAMQMVAAAKLRRAQEAAESARPYAVRMAAVLANLAGSAKSGADAHPLLAGRSEEKVHLLVVATSERGLAGAFNSSIVRLAREHARRLKAEGKTVKILPVGKKGRDALKRDYGDAFYGKPIDFQGLKSVGYAQAQQISERVLAGYEAGDFDVATYFFATFKSVIAQEPTALRIIPAEIPAAPEGAETGGASAQYEYEPDEATILSDLLPRNLTAQIFRGLLENAASEQGARMSAMDNATRNAGDIIKKLTVEYNRSRQAAITKELIEIISGAEAL
ncbi:F0F1 ATP synthase subunit gamma [Neomegalonema perideroedes]|uniref:F0F1 ATP synthase subunit gamma n=1 Tax=Neomegalonema perideroedes TaxID=217219 RepID=UPI00035CE919|nr:F0F1 ATP synthase subunit gamma [Neomegalonema perideroedes]